MIPFGVEPRMALGFLLASVYLGLLGVIAHQRRDLLLVSRVLETLSKGYTKEVPTLTLAVVLYCLGLGTATTALILWLRG